MVVPIRAKKPTPPEAKPAAEPQQWTGLSAQLANDYQHDDEHSPNSPMRQSAPPAATPPARQAAAAVVEHAYPVKHVAVHLKPKPKPISPQTRPAASPFGPNQQWAGLSATMADDVELPHTAEVVDDEREREEARRLRSVQPGVSPSTTPAAPHVASGSPGRSQEPKSPARAGLAAAEPLSPSFRPMPAGLEPMQWLGLSQDPSSALHNMAPSPENSRQRQRRLSRELEREVAAAKLAEEEKRVAGCACVAILTRKPPRLLARAA